MQRLGTGVSPSEETKIEGAGAPAFSTSDLFRGKEREIVIEHNGDLYRLRITRQGKLILNK